MSVISYSIVHFVKKCYETKVERVSDEENYCKDWETYNLFFVILKNMILQHITYAGSFDKHQVSKDVYVERNKRFLTMLLNAEFESIQRRW